MAAIAVFSGTATIRERTNRGLMYVQKQYAFHATLAANSVASSWGIANSTHILLRNARAILQL